jgi:rhodanese-related sulfurtransferase
MSYQTITPAEFAARRESGEDLLLIDVREPVEYEIARVEGAELLPMSRFYEWAGTLGQEREIVVMCHHGIRSARVCAALAQGGFTRLYNLAGGIDRWAQEVDTSVPLY